LASLSAGQNDDSIGIKN